MQSDIGVKRNGTYFTLTVLSGVTEWRGNSLHSDTTEWCGAVEGEDLIYTINIIVTVHFIFRKTLSNYLSHGYCCIRLSACPMPSVTIVMSRHLNNMDLLGGSFWSLNDSQSVLVSLDVVSAAIKVSLEREN